MEDPGTRFAEFFKFLNYFSGLGCFRRKQSREKCNKYLSLWKHRFWMFH